METLLRTIKEHGWLIMFGRCGGHSHSCMHLMFSLLYSSYESAVPFKSDSVWKSQMSGCISYVSEQKEGGRARRLRCWTPEPETVGSSPTGV